MTEKLETEEEVSGVFKCTCGGIFMVIKVEEYPKHLSGMERLNYPRSCTVKCDKCGTIKENQPYD